MARQTVERILAYRVWAGNGDGDYDQGVVYDNWDELAHDLQEALATYRHVLIEPALLTEQEYSASGEPFPAEVNPLLRRKD